MPSKQPQIAKRKLSPRTWLNVLFGTRRIAFVSPYSLEQCVALLNQQHDTRFFANPKIWVKLQQIDDDTQRLQFTVAYMRSNRMSVTGYLKRWEQNTTLINVMPESYVVLQLISFLIAVVVCVWIASSVQDFSLFCLVAPLLIAFVWTIFRVSSNEQHYHLQYDLQELLQIAPSN